MKHIQWTALAMLAFVLAMSGCASPATATPIPIIELDSNSAELSTVQASAQVVPAQESRLSFTLPGPIKEVNVQKGDTVEAGQILVTLDAPDLEYGLLEAEAAVRVAEFDYQYWQLPRRVGGRVVERGEVAQQELEVARRELDTSQAEFARSNLVAPFRATVVSVEVRSGEFVQPGQVIIVLAKLDNLFLETTDLSELNIAAVEIGQPATVYIEALDEEFPGEVTAISPISDTIGGDVVYTVTIELDEQPDDLLWGMSADVEIQTEQ
jgi:RND family efflux transporter MFP subunit